MGQRPCFAADGNLRNNGVFTFTYDSANRLITVTNGTTLTLGYRYNGDGARAAKTVNGVTTTYIIAVLGLPQVLVETTGGQSTVYLYGHDLLAEEGTAWAWHLGDGLGSVRQLINGTGDVTLAQGYTPFGVPLWSEGSAASGYGFTGEQEDAAVGLVFLRVRYYDPAVGRFIGRDPLPGNVRQPGSLNRWVYVLNNSPNLVDPLGLQPGPGFIERGVNRAIWDFERGADRWLYDASYLSVVEEVYDATKANLVAGRYLNGSIRELYNDTWLNSWIELSHAGFCGGSQMLESAHVSLVVLGGVARNEGRGAGAFAPGYIQNLEVTDPRERQGPDTTWHFFFHAFLSFEVLYSQEYNLETGQQLTNRIGLLYQALSNKIDMVREKYWQYVEEYGFEEFAYLSEGGWATTAYNTAVTAGDFYEVYSTYVQSEEDKPTDAFLADPEDFKWRLLHPDPEEHSGIQDPGVFSRDLRANRMGADFGVRAFYQPIIDPDPNPPYFDPLPR